jgi:hypothetical protein
LNGGSGNADSHFFEYKKGAWIINDPASGKFIDRRWSGGDKTLNAYPHGLVIKNGRRYVTWCWRDTPDPKTSHDLCFAYSDDQGKSWKNNEGEIIGMLGDRPITADSPGVAVIRIPPGMRYQNSGSLAVDDYGGIHVLCRDENGAPTLFRRNPESGAWSRHRTSGLGKLMAAKDDALFIVTDGRVQRVAATRFRNPETVATSDRAYTEDSKACMDRMRNDGWISVIGQRGKTVTVVDYRTGL